MYMKRILELIVCVTVSTGLFLFGPVCPVQPFSATPENLQNTYREIEALLNGGQFAIPMHLESLEERNALRGDVYGIIETPFMVLRDALVVPANWCDIVLLHHNIKACTSRRAKDKCLLTFFTGRKFYQIPEEARPLTFDYQVIAETPEQVKVLLTADDGPMDTKDYRIELEAIPLSEGRAFAHFSYTYRYGAIGRMAIKTYFATLGRGKVGFSVIGVNGEGSKVYVGGTRGMIERNVVRYYYAIQAYLNTLQSPEHERFDQCMSQWYDLTDQHRRQLFEMKKKQYLDGKRRERQNQLLLQRELTPCQSGNPKYQSSN